MAIRNLHFYGANRTRAYPLDDAATAIDDLGVVLPTQFLADLHLRWPDTLGNVAFVSAFYSSPRMISLVIQAAESDTSTSGFAPLATISITTPFTPGRHVAVEPQADGVGGWVVIGCDPRTQPVVNCRFSAPAQSMLAARAARPYRPLPVSSLAKFGNEAAMTGVINLTARSPLEIVSESKDIDGAVRDVIVIRLTQPPEVTANVFETFAGPCGQRPESQSCGDPQPIEYIDTVGPDCNGNITIEFQGCAVPGKILDQCGIALDCSLNIPDTCLRDSRLADDQGRLPLGTYAIYSGLDAEVSETSEDCPDNPNSESLPTCELPYCESFEDTSDATPPDWEVRRGAFSFVSVTAGPGDTPVSPGEVNYCQNPLGGDPLYAWSSEPGVGGRNISLWRHCDDTALERRYTTDFRMCKTSFGAKYNASILFNYKEFAYGCKADTYYAAEVDWDGARLNLLYFNGRNYQIVASMPVLGITVEVWNRLIVETTQSGDEVAITVTFGRVDTDGTITGTSVLGPTSVPNSRYTPSDGVLCGIMANQAGTRFSFFHVDAY